MIALIFSAPGSMSLLGASYFVYRSCYTSINQIRLLIVPRSTFTNCTLGPNQTPSRGSVAPTVIV